MAYGKTEKERKYHAAYVRRWTLRKGTGWIRERNWVMKLRDESRSSWEEMAKIFKCAPEQVITLYVQEREKGEEDRREKPKQLTEMLEEIPKLKYEHLIHEPINEGKSYQEYVDERKTKQAPARRERMKVLKQERRERIARCGPIRIKKVSPRGYNRFGKNFASF